MPADPSGSYQQGLTEWEDVGAAVAFAEDRGADRVAIFGSSMGGAIAASVLRESPTGAEPSAAVWDRLDYTRQATEYDTPILLFHGTDDDSVPIEPSQRLAELRPDLVELVEVVGAGHVRSWNADPETYEARLVTFLEDRFE